MSRLLKPLFLTICLWSLAGGTGQSAVSEMPPKAWPKHDFSAWPTQIKTIFSGVRVGGYAFMARYHGQPAVVQVGGYARMPFEREGAGMEWTPTTAMHVASVSKTITAVAFLKLWEEQNKSFSLDTPFWPYLKDLCPDATERSKQITFRHLLTHTSGLKPPEGTGDATIPDAAKILACRTNNVPGKGMYQNINFYFLRLLIERMSGQAYPEYVQNHVLFPCGARNMRTRPEDHLPLLNYTAHAESNLPGDPFTDMTARAGGYGWYASPVELSAFVYGATSGVVLSEATTRLMLEEGFGWGKLRFGDVVLGYGKNGEWSWWTWTDSTGKRSGHGNSHIIHFVDGVDVVLLVNSDQGPNLLELAIDLWRQERGQPSNPEALALAARKAAEKRKDAAARAVKFWQEKAWQGDSDAQFHLGQHYLTGDGVEKDVAKARDFFRKAAAQGNKEAQSALQRLGEYESK